MWRTGEGADTDYDTKFYCNGSKELGTSRFHCWAKDGHGKLNLIEATVKEFKTLFESPIQVIFNLDIGFFLISSTVNTSDKICVG